MGCEQSRCMSRADGEVEIGIEPSTTNQHSVVKMPQKDPSFKINEKGFVLQSFKVLQNPYNNKQTSSQGPNIIGLTGTNDDSTKIAKSDFSTTLAMTITDRNLQTAVQTPLLLANHTDLRFGKSPDELASDMSRIKSDIPKIMRIYNQTEANIKRVEAMLGKWHTKIFDEICKKTGEIKSSIMLNTNLTAIIFKQEVSCYTVDELLVEFCKENMLSFSQSWVSSNLRKVTELSSLTFSFGMEINLTGKDGVEFFVFLNALKHFTKESMERVLVGNCEKNNIGVWFDLHSPMPTDFGFLLNPRFQTSEFCLGFLIFDSSGRTNLKRAMSAFQSYGAEFDAAQVAALKKVPSEELRVCLSINESGVSKVILWIPKLIQEVGEEMIAVFTKGTKNKAWESATELLKDDGTFRYFLEFSTEGFQFGYECRVGKEFGSFIYFDTSS